MRVRALIMIVFNKGLTRFCEIFSLLAKRNGYTVVGFQRNIRSSVYISVCICEVFRHSADRYVSTLADCQKLPKGARLLKRKFCFRGQLEP